MSPQRFTTLFLDIGGVLLSNGWDRYARARAAELFHLEFDEMNERHHLTFNIYEEGKLTLDDYLERVVFFRERSFPREAFKQFMLDQSVVLPGMIELIGRIKQRNGLKTVAVSNEGRELTMHRVQTFHLDSVIDFFVSSCFVHFRKPDHDMYRIALDAAQVNPSQVLYLDDRPLFIEVARGLGIRGIEHQTLEKTKAAFADAGLAVE